MAVSSVSVEGIERVAREVFGSDATIKCVRAIAPSKSHGITKTPPATRNLLYVVELEDHPEPYVFRFSRVENDVYDQEIQNYSLLAEQTGVRVPAIFGYDTSCAIVPTSYMVMDYLHGKLWNYAAHPANPNTDTSDKAAIEEVVGRFYAKVHQISGDAGEVGSEAQTLLYAMDRLETAADRGHVRTTPAEIDLCRQAILDEPAFQEKELSLCLADTEIHVAKEGREWQVAFICDAEWVGYRHRFYDLAQMVAAPSQWWRLEMPARYLDAGEVARRPFFRGYNGALDHRELLRIASYYQLGLWAYLAMSAESPGKIRWVTEDKGELIEELIRLVSMKAAPAHG